MTPVQLLTTSCGLLLCNRLARDFNRAKGHPRRHRSAPVDGWQLTFTCPGHQRITNAWSTTYQPAGSNITAVNASYDGTIGPRRERLQKNVVVGVIAHKRRGIRGESHSGNVRSSRRPRPSGFRLAVAHVAGQAAVAGAVAGSVSVG